MRRLTIGELARQAGVGVETVRYYEGRGLLKKPPRKGKGFRVYPPEALHALQLIRRAKGLGFSLKEIGALLRLQATGADTPAALEKMLDAKLAELAAKARDLERTRHVVAELLEKSRAAPNGKGVIDRVLLEGPLS
jgi:DNA-binding transcriptional MerR regulator